MAQVYFDTGKGPDEATAMSAFYATAVERWGVPRDVIEVIRAQSGYTPNGSGGTFRGAYVLKSGTPRLAAKEGDGSRASGKDPARHDGPQDALGAGPSLVTRVRQLTDPR